MSVGFRVGYSILDRASSSDFRNFDFVLMFSNLGFEFSLDLLSRNFLRVGFLVKKRSRFIFRIPRSILGLYRG